METEYLQRIWQLQYTYKQNIGEVSAIDFIPPGKYHSSDCLISGGEGSGKNFLLSQTFNYAKERACDAGLLALLGNSSFFNDLCSDAALVFNLFLPIRLMLNEDPRSATRVLSNALRNYSINAVCEVGIFAFSDFSCRYLSASLPMQAYILWMDRNGGKHLTSLVVRYSHFPSLADREYTANQCRQLLHTGLFTSALRLQIQSEGHHLETLYLPLLFTERYREVHALKDSSTVVLTPQSYPGITEEISAVTSCLDTSYSRKLTDLRLDRFVESLLLYAPEFYKDAFQLFKDRYLGF